MLQFGHLAFVGPLSNLVIAIIFGLIIRYVIGNFDIESSTIISFVQVTSYIVIINIVLAVFNLVPIPPLDGSKLLFSVLPNQYSRVRHVLESYGPILALIVVFFLWQFISPVIPWIFQILTGVGV